MTTDIKQLRGTERLIRLDCLFDGKAGCACSHCEASDTIARLAAERDRLAGEVASLQNTFDLMWKADQRAIKLWQEATGKDHIWPDRTKTTLWLLERAEAAEADRDRLAKSEEGLLKTLGLERRAKHALMHKTCKWVRDCTEDGDCHWETACGTGWCTTWNTPAEDNYNYCPSCGGKVEHVKKED